jgi:hypothetical protein
MYKTIKKRLICKKSRETAPLFIYTTTPILEYEEMFPADDDCNTLYQAFRRGASKVKR